MINKFQPVNGYPNVASTITPQELFDYYENFTIYDPLVKTEGNRKHDIICNADKHNINLRTGKWISRSEVYGLSQQILPHDPKDYYYKVIRDRQGNYSPTLKNLVINYDQELQSYGNIISLTLYKPFDYRFIITANASVKNRYVVITIHKGRKYSGEVDIYSDKNFDNLVYHEDVDNMYDYLYSNKLKSLFI